MNTFGVRLYQPTTREVLSYINDLERARSSTHEYRHAARACRIRGTSQRHASDPPPPPPPHTTKAL